MLFEDNVCAQTFVKATKMNVRTKHICTRYHHLREAVRKNILLVERVDTKDQLADIFTKATPKDTFEHLRSSIMGWLVMFKRVDKKGEETAHFKKLAKVHANICKLSGMK